MDGNTTVERIPSLVAGLRKAWKSGKTLDVEWRRQQLHLMAKLLNENRQEVISQ